MSKIQFGCIVLGIAFLMGCAGRTTEETTYDEAAEQRPNEPAEHRAPEPPKVKADDVEREFD